MKLLANLLVLATLGFARAEPNTIEEDAYLMVRSSEPLPYAKPFEREIQANVASDKNVVLLFLSLFLLHVFAHPISPMCTLRISPVVPLWPLFTGQGDCGHGETHDWTLRP